MNWLEIDSKQQESLVLLDVAHFGKKNSFFLILSPFNGLIKKICLNKSKYSSEMAPFQTC